MINAAFAPWSHKPLRHRHPAKKSNENTDYPYRQNAGGNATNANRRYKQALENYIHSVFHYKGEHTVSEMLMQVKKIAFYCSFIVFHILKR